MWKYDQSRPMMQSVMSDLLILLSRLTYGKDGQFKTLAGLLIGTSTVLLASAWNACSEQTIPRLLGLSLIGYLASVVTGVLAYLFLTIDLHRLMVSENEDVLLLDDEELYRTEEIEEDSVQWPEKTKILLLVFQIGSFLLASVLLLTHHLVNA